MDADIIKKYKMAKVNGTQTIAVKSDEENPEPLELIAQSIIEIANAFQGINNSRLKRRTVVLLLKDMTGLPIRDIDLILDCAPRLKDHYVKQSTK